MRYVLFTYAGPDRVADWDAMTSTEKQADIARVMVWFREHGQAGRIVGGEELGLPSLAHTVRKRGITDGPFIETKEMLGGFIVVEVESEAMALEMARTWPGIVHDSDRVEVWPVGSTDADVAEQARAEGGAASDAAGPAHEPAHEEAGPRDAAG
jgi:hypothetical protein